MSLHSVYVCSHSDYVWLFCFFGPAINMSPESGFPVVFLSDLNHTVDGSGRTVVMSVYIAVVRF